MSDHVLYSLPDGAQSSVLLRTALMHELTRRGGVAWKWVSPLTNEAEFACQFDSPRGELLPWPAGRWSRLDHFIQVLRQEVWKTKTGTATSAVFSHRLRHISPLRYHLATRLARWLARRPRIDGLLTGVEHRLVGDGAWGRLLDRVPPRAVVLGSAAVKLAEVPLARAARRRGIPIFGIVPSWDNLTSKGSPVHWCDRLAVWSAAMRDEAVRYYGFRPDQICITGPPQFDLYADPPPWQRETLLARLGLDPHRRLITYTSVTPAVCPFSAGYAELLADWITGGRLQEPCQLLVRMHPQDDFSAFQRVAKRPHVHLQWPGRYHRRASGHSAIAYYDPTPQDLAELTATLAASDVVVNIASTITLEACALDRPVVNVAFNLSQMSRQFINIAQYYDLDHYQPVTDSGAVTIARSATQLHQAIDAALAKPAFQSAARRTLYGRYDPFGDGRSALRLAEAILEFIQSGTSTRRQRRAA